MSATVVSLWSAVRRLLPPNKFFDQDPIEHPVRIESYGTAWLTGLGPSEHNYVEEGSYLVSTGVGGGLAVGTGLTWPYNNSAFADINPNFLIQNTDQTKWLFLHYLKMTATAVSGSAGNFATSIQYAVEIDSVLRTPTTDNTLLCTPVIPNMVVGSSTTVPTMVVKAQNATADSVIPALSARGRVVARGALGGLNVIGDELLLKFGSTKGGAYAATTTTENAGQPGRRVSSAPAVVLGPGHSAAIYIWSPGTAAAVSGGINPEFELTAWMR